MTMWWVSLSFFHFILNWHTKSLSYLNIGYFVVFFPWEKKSRVEGWRERLSWSLTHLMMIVVERAERTTPYCHIAIITTCALFPFCCFSHPSLHMSQADRINYASLLSKHKIHGGSQIQWGTAAIISWWFYISSRWWGGKKRVMYLIIIICISLSNQWLPGDWFFSTHIIYTHTCSLDTHTEC